MTIGAPASPAISLRRVGKTYPGGVEALREFDLDVETGDFVSLLGPSGCGKSTALRLMAGLSRPTAGTVALGDGNMRPEIGFVFQEPTLMPWATALGNVLLPLRIKRVPGREAEARAREALARVGLADAVDLHPRALSGGMKMRVSIARALVTRPDILLMDEPFAALDEITRFKLNDDLLSLWREAGWTVVFVTHSVFESVYLSRRVLVMGRRPGRIAADLIVDEPYPRTEAFRTAPNYASACRETSQALHAAMALEETDGDVERAGDAP